MKLLNCIISYNRPHYLRNTLESLLEYFRFGDTLVMDDGSDDPSLVDYLSRLPETGIRVVRKERRFPSLYHGGLYALMNEAVDYTLAEGYDLVNIIQDDMQFMWHDPNILAKVMRIFSVHDDALQVQNLFHKKIMKYSLIENDRIEFHEESNSYHGRPYGVGDLGFLLLERVKRADFHYLDSEGEAGNYWRGRGYKMYALYSPTLAFIPWPQTIQGGRRVKQWIGKMHPPPRKYYLKPLSPEQSARLQARPLREMPFLEDYSAPWGWRCIYPAWYTRISSRHDLMQYMRLLMTFWRNGEYVVPRFVIAK